MLGLVIHVNIDNDGRGRDSYDTSVIPLNTTNIEEARKAMKDYADNTVEVYKEFFLDDEDIAITIEPYPYHEPEDSCIVVGENIWTKLCIATLWEE